MTIKKFQDKEVLRQSAGDPAVVVEAAMVEVVDADADVVVVVDVVVVGSTLISKLVLTIVFPWRIRNCHNPLSMERSETFHKIFYKYFLYLT